MKSIEYIKKVKSQFQSALHVASLFLILVIPRFAFSQDSTAVPEKELISPSIEFTSVQKSDSTVDLKAILKAKINGAQVKLYGMKVSFSAGNDSSVKELGTVITDGRGIARITCKATDLVTDAEGKLHFKASFAGNKSAESAEEELSVKRALLQIIPVKGDSTYSVTVKLFDYSSGAEMPVPETVIGIFVKRSFNPLKVAEATTDSSGEASADVPVGLPGDDKGNITLLAKIDDNEQFGNMEAAVVQPWGTPVSSRIEELPRALWSPHPPIWMLVTFIVLMLAVWGHYVVIVYELFRLRKERPKTIVEENA